MANYLIAGCGYVGSELARQMVRRGHAVHAIRRTATAFPQGVTGHALDLSKPFALPQFPPLDGVVLSLSAGGFTEAHYRAAYERAPANLVAALEAAGQRPSRCVYTSSTGVYGPGDGSVVDEDTPVNPARFSARALKAGEDILFRSLQPWTALRLGGIYGPGRDRLIDEVSAGTARFDPERPVWASLIHRDDAASAIAHVLALGAAAPPVLLGVDTEPALRGDMIRWLAERLGVDTRSMQEKADGPPARGNKRCSSARLTASGFAFEFPTFRDGYGSLLDARAVQLPPASH